MPEISTWPFRCRAADPARCRTHKLFFGPGAPRLADFFTDTNGRKRSREEVLADFLPADNDGKPFIGRALSVGAVLKYREHILADVRENTKAQTRSDGDQEVSVYRAGEARLPAKRGSEQAVFQAADQQAPAGRSGRSEAIFCGVCVDAGARWVLEAAEPIRHIPFKEIRINSHEVYVYSVSLWDRVTEAALIHGQASSEFIQAADTYWRNGMPLSAWYGYLRDNTAIDPRDWEVLVTPDQVDQVDDVAPAELTNSLYRYSDSDSEKILDRIRYGVPVGV